MLIRILLLLLLAFSTFAGGARADDYVPPTWRELTRTLVRFSALDLSDSRLLDEYLTVTDCELYKAFYRDDFKWNTVRKAALQSIKTNIATFPMRYRYVTPREMDRYDFGTKVFRFTERSRVNNVNSFALYSVGGTGCGDAEVSFLPRVFRAVVSEPVYMDGLALTENEAKTLVEHMVRDGNTRRVIWLRFNMHIVYIEPLTKLVLDATIDKAYRYRQASTPEAGTVRLDARLESIEAYEDENLTKLIYTIQL